MGVEESGGVLGPDVSRRGFLQKGAATGLLLGASGPLLAACGGVKESSGGSSDTLKIGFVSPRTGPAASFGEPDPFIIKLAQGAVKDGLKVGDKTYKIEVIDKDGPNPQRSGEVANELINSNQVDLMLATSTPETVNPVADACEAAGVPCMTTVAPWEAWYFGRGAKPGKPSPFKWTYHFSFGVEDFAQAYLPTWDSVPTNKKCGVLWPNDADGNAIREGLGPLLEKGGYKIIDPGAFPDGLNDFSAQINKFKAEKCEVFNTFALPPDFSTFWKQAAQQGYQPKLPQIAKHGLFPSQVEALGPLGINITTTAFWHPTFPYKSSLTGLTSTQLKDKYESGTGRQWNQVVGSSMALWDVGIQALKDSGDPKDRQKVATAMSKLSVETPVGKLEWGKGPVPNVVVDKFVNCNWIKDPTGKHPLDLIVVNNAQLPDVPVAAKIKTFP
jgi:branched-chain amino acid transport system substrate-binding protein